MDGSLSASNDGYMPRKHSPGTFPNSIRKWREYRNLKQVALVERLRELGVKTTAASLSRIENGAQNYDAELLLGLADALRCEPPDLVVRRPPSKDRLELMSVIEGMSDEQRRRAVGVLRAAFEAA